MGIAYDNTGAGFNGLVNASGTYSWSHTVNTTGANVYADFMADRASTLSSITCGGNAMTLVGTASFTGASGNAFISRYKLTNVTAGTYTISATSSVAVFGSANSVSYTGVASEGSAQTASGSTTALSQSTTVPPGAGQWLIQSFGGRSTTASGCTLSSLVGGTNRYNGSSSASALAINEAQGSTTFTATGGGGGTFATWGGLATTLIPTQGPGFGATGGWAGPVTIPNRFVGPMALRQQKRPPYVPFRSTGLQAPVAFDQQGSGFYGAVSGTTGSWTDNATQGAYVIVALSGFINVASSGGFSGVTYNGVPMTRLCDNYFNSVPGNGPLTFYGLANAPGGTNTVQFTTVSTGAYVTANSFSYTGVGGVSPFPWPAYNNSSSLSQSITNVANGLVFQAFGTNSLALTGLTGGDIRFNQTATPATTNVAGLAVQDSTASGSITFSAATSSSSVWAGMGIILSPNAWPTVSTPPFSAALTKFSNQQNVTIQIIGDSTSYGYLDGQNLSGWVGRLGIILGNYYDYNVKLQQYTGTTYGAATTLRSSPRGGAAPTLLIYDAGIVGALLINDLSYISQNNQIVATPDVVFAGDGINEALNGYNAEEYVGLWGVELGYITNIYCPNVPVIVTTENVLGNQGSTNYAVDDPILASFLSALAQKLVGSSVPLGAALVQGSYNVSMLDTRQAFLYQYQTSLMADGAHPNQFGYQVQANWMASILAPRTVTAIGASCPPVQIPNRFVGPMALRQTKRLPVVSYQRQGYMDGASTAWTVTDSPGASVGIRGNANAAWSFTDPVTGVRGARDAANRAITFTDLAAGIRGVRDGANSTLVFTRSAGGLRAIRAGANSVWTVADVPVGIRAAHDGANLALILSDTPTGVRGARAGANIVLSVHDIPTGLRAIRDGANQVILVTRSAVGPFFVVQKVLIPAENRTIVLPPEDRIIIVRKGSVS
jgi:lysophospholipase L1-like esterase